MIMLDTHIAVGLFQGSTAGLSRKALALIDREPAYLSPAVSLELQLLKEIGRLRLGAHEVLGYLARTLAVHQANDRFSDIVQHAMALSFTRDPFDRLITAHAAMLKATLITHDALIHRHYRQAMQ